MNAEQKQRMAHELGQWNAAMKSSCSVTDLLAISTRMAALLHELIDASYNAPPGAKWRLGDTVQKVRGSKWRDLLEGQGGMRTVDQFFAEIDQLSETADERAEEILGALYDWAEAIVPEH